MRNEDVEAVLRDEMPKGRELEKELGKYPLCGLRRGQYLLEIEAATRETTVESCGTVT